MACFRTIGLITNVDACVFRFLFSVCPHPATITALECKLIIPITFGFSFCLFLIYHIIKSTEPVQCEHWLIVNRLMCIKLKFVEFEFKRIFPTWLSHLWQIILLRVSILFDAWLHCCYLKMHRAHQIGFNWCNELESQTYYGFNWNVEHFVIRNVSVLHCHQLPLH